MKGKLALQALMFLFIALTATHTVSAYQQAYYTGTYSQNTYGHYNTFSARSSCGNQFGAHTRQSCNNGRYATITGGYNIAAPYYLGYRTDRYVRNNRFKGHYNARSGTYHDGVTGAQTWNAITGRPLDPRMYQYGNGFSAREFYHPNTWNTARY